MRRLLPLLVACLLAACASLAPQDSQQADAARLDDLVAIGRIGPGGGPLLADRGIGGTGAPLTMSSSSEVADRGIGGTGIGGIGIGGPGMNSIGMNSPGMNSIGIVGVVTGFGSVFVNGLEIQYDSSATVDIDGMPSSISALRVGQLVALRTEISTGASFARRISVRSEVVGRIESLELGSGILTVAGQAVSVPPGTWGANQFALGDWVKVSGLRRPDGAVLASRLDRAPAGTFMVRGIAAGHGDTMRIGNLLLDKLPTKNVQNGQFVVVLGSYSAGKKLVSGVESDTLSANPAAYFGASTNRLLVQAFVKNENGSLTINGAKVPTASTFSGGAVHEGLAVVALQRGADGSYVASGLRAAQYRSQPVPAVRGGDRPTRGETPRGRQQSGSTLPDLNENGTPSTTASGGEVDASKAVASSIALPMATANAMSMSLGEAIGVAPLTSGTALIPSVATIQSPFDSFHITPTVAPVEQANTVASIPVAPVTATPHVPEPLVVPVPFLAVPALGSKASPFFTVPMVQGTPNLQGISVNSSRILPRAVERGFDGRTRIVGGDGANAPHLGLLTGTLKSGRLGHGSVDRGVGGVLSIGKVGRESIGFAQPAPKTPGLIAGRVLSGGGVAVHGH